MGTLEIVMYLVKAIFFLLVFGCILFLAVVTSKYVSGKTKKMHRGRYIEIIDSLGLGMDKAVYLIKAGEQFILIASAGKNIEFLTTVKIDDYVSENPDTTNSMPDFKALLDKYVQTLKNMGNKNSIKSEVEIEKSNSIDNSFKKNLDKIKKLNKTDVMGR